MSQALSIERSTLDIGITPSILKSIGRAWARQHLGQRAWRPSADVEKDETAWRELIQYLAERQLDHTVEILAKLADSQPVSHAESCIAGAWLYRSAATDPQRRVGGTRLLDFVRSLDLLAATGARSDPSAR